MAYGLVWSQFMAVAPPPHPHYCGCEGCWDHEMGLSLEPIGQIPASTLRLYREWRDRKRVLRHAAESARAAAQRSDLGPC